MGCRGPTWLCLVSGDAAVPESAITEKKPSGYEPTLPGVRGGADVGAGDGISERKTSVLSKGETQNSTPPQDPAPFPSAGPPLPPQQPAHTFPIALYW